jgi:hypothetical protein
MMLFILVRQNREEKTMQPVEHCADQREGKRVESWPGENFAQPG